MPNQGRLFRSCVQQALPLPLPIIFSPCLPSLFLSRSPHPPTRPQNNQHPNPHHNTHYHTHFNTATHSPPLPSSHYPSIPPPFPISQPVPARVLPSPPRHRTHFYIYIPLFVRARRHKWARLHVEAEIVEALWPSWLGAGWKVGGKEFWLGDWGDGGEGR